MIFTGRESEIMKLIAHGQTSEAIAKQLLVSLRTIENIKLNLLFYFDSFFSKKGFSKRFDSF